MKSEDLLRFLCYFILCAILVILLQVFTARDNHQHEDTKKTSELHWRRRLQHATTGLLFIGLSYIIPVTQGSIMLLLGALLFYVAHRVRLRSESFQKTYLKLFGSLLRPHEVHGLPGAFFFLVGTGLSFLWFPLNIARFSLLCLSLADPIAAIVGMTVGGPKIDDNNTLSGSFACFGLSLGMGFWMLPTLKQAFVGAFASAMAEALACRVGLDDNLLIPISTGAAVWCFG